jgi:hypothetical protein
VNAPVSTVGLLLVWGLWGARPAAAATPRYLELGSFVLGCDNGNGCHAVGFQGDAPGAPLMLDLQREAGAEGRMSLALSAAHRFAPKALRVDGKASPTLAALPWREAPRGAETRWSLQNPAAIRRFLEFVRGARRIDAGEGGHRMSLSLDGLGASLRWIDDLQGRRDTVTAWSRLGAKSAQQVPPAPPLPVLESAPRPAKLAAAERRRLTATVRSAQALLLRAEDCAEDPGGRPKDLAYALDAHEALVLLGCRNAVYNVRAIAFGVQRSRSGAAQRLVLPVLDTEPDQPNIVQTLINPEFDPATATLSHRALARGMGDCGESASWRFDGRTFVLARFAYLGRCAGAARGDWPVLWRSQTLRRR